MLYQHLMINAEEPNKIYGLGTLPAIGNNLTGIASLNEFKKVDFPLPISGSILDFTITKRSSPFEYGLYTYRFIQDGKLYKVGNPNGIINMDGQVLSMSVNEYNSPELMSTYNDWIKTNNYYAIRGTNGSGYLYYINNSSSFAFNNPVGANPPKITNLFTYFAGGAQYDGYGIIKPYYDMIKISEYSDWTDLPETFDPTYDTNGAFVIRNKKLYVAGIPKRAGSNNIAPDTFLPNFTQVDSNNDWYKVTHTGIIIGMRGIPGSANLYCFGTGIFLPLSGNYTASIPTIVSGVGGPYSDWQDIYKNLALRNNQLYRIEPFGNFSQIPHAYAPVSGVENIKFRTLSNGLPITTSGQLYIPSGNTYIPINSDTDWKMGYIDSPLYFGIKNNNKLYYLTTQRANNQLNLYKNNSLPIKDNFLSNIQFTRLGYFNNSFNTTYGTEAIIISGRLYAYNDINNTLNELPTSGTNGVQYYNDWFELGANTNCQYAIRGVNGSGRLYSRGDNVYGQLGDPSLPTGSFGGWYSYPYLNDRYIYLVEVSGIGGAAGYTDWMKVSCHGNNAIFALRKVNGNSGVLYSWGYNRDSLCATYNSLIDVKLLNPIGPTGNPYPWINSGICSDFALHAPAGFSCILSGEIHVCGKDQYTYGSYFNRNGTSILYNPVRCGTLSNVEMVDGHYTLGYAVTGSGRYLYGCGNYLGGGLLSNNLAGSYGGVGSANNLYSYSLIAEMDIANSGNIKELCMHDVYGPLFFLTSSGYLFTVGAPFSIGKGTHIVNGLNPAINLLQQPLLVASGIKKIINSKYERNGGNTKFRFINNNNEVFFIGHNNASKTYPSIANYAYDITPSAVNIKFYPSKYTDLNSVLYNNKLYIYGETSSTSVFKISNSLSIFSDLTISKSLNDPTPLYEYVTTNINNLNLIPYNGQDNITKINTGGNNSAILITNNTLYSFGSNQDFQTCTNNKQFITHHTSGMLSFTGQTATDCSAGLNHSLAIINNKLYSFGNNASGQLGRQDDTLIVCGTGAELTAVTLTAPSGYTFASVDFASYGTPNGSCGNFSIGGCHSSKSQSIVENYLLGSGVSSAPYANRLYNKTGSITIQNDNTTFGDPCVGTGKRLYIQATVKRPVAQSNVDNSTNWIQCSAGENFSLAIKGYNGSGQLYAFGGNANYRTGLNINTGNTFTPTLVSGTQYTDWVFCCAGTTKSYAIRSSGNNRLLYTFGSGSDGIYTTPTLVSGNQYTDWISCDIIKTTGIGLRGVNNSGYIHYPLDTISNSIHQNSNFQHVAIARDHIIAVNTKNEVYVSGFDFKTPNVSNASLTEVATNLVTNNISKTAIDHRKITKIASGRKMTGYIANGKLYGFGINQYTNGPYMFKTSGAKVYNSATEYSMPEGVTNDNWIDYSVGIDHVLAIRGFNGSGKLYAMGSNSYGKTGLNTTTGNTDLLIQVGTFEDWTTCSAGATHSLAIRSSSGLLYSWGDNSNGSTGLNLTSGTTLVPTQVGSSSGWSLCSAGAYYSLAVQNNQLYAFGTTNNGATSFNVTMDKFGLSPFPPFKQFTISSDNFLIPTLAYFGAPFYVTSYDSGNMFSPSILINNGKLYSYPTSDTSVRASDGFGVGVTIPDRYLLAYKSASGEAASSGWIHCASNPSNSQAIGIKSLLPGQQSGQLYTWGSNANGALGRNTTTGNAEVSIVDSNTDWIYCHMGNSCAFAIRGNGGFNGSGTLYTCGSNANGRTGLNTSTGTTLVFTQVGSFTDWKSIKTTLGTNTPVSLGIRSSGLLYAWGSNTNGTTGQNTFTGNTIVPTQIGTFTDWITCSIDKTGATAVGIRGTNGSGYLYEWGQLSPRMNSSIPVLVSGFENDNTWHNCWSTSLLKIAVKKENGIDTYYAWGSSSKKLFQYNDIPSSSIIPLKCMFINSGISVDRLYESEYDDVIAILKNEKYIKAINSSAGIPPRINGVNVLFNNNYLNIPTKVDTQPFSNITGWKKISASKNIYETVSGIPFSYCLDNQGRLWTAGNNYYGQLGLGMVTIPIRHFRQPFVINNNDENYMEPSGFVDCDAGYYHGLAIHSNGKAYGCGKVGFGVLGNDIQYPLTSGCIAVFNEIPNTTNRNFKLCSAGLDHSMFSMG